MDITPLTPAIGTHSPKRAFIIILLNVIVVTALYLLLPNITNISQKATSGICLLIFVGILWLTEAIHVTITALLIPLLAVALNLLNANTALKAFADPIIFLFFGGFALATALHIQGLDRYIANKMIAIAKGKMWLAIIMLFLTTAFLSMWISNTATAAIMLPLGLGILSNLDQEKDRKTFVFVLLGIAYSASIGGFGTLVGSPPNAIAAQAIGMNFFDWMKIGIPFMIVTLPSCIFLMYLVIRPKLNKTFNLQVEHQTWNIQKIITIIIFILTALAWIFSTKISSYFGKIDDLDALIAIAAAVAIGFSGVASWNQIQKNTEWGVLWLFGGGLALSKILKDSGASDVMARGMSSIFGNEFDSWIIIIIAVATFIIFLTEFTSNTASAALLVPLFATVGESIGMPIALLTLVIGFGASCAFMLPVATPPNAIVFGTGHIKQSEMVKVGICLNILCIALVSAFAWFVWRFI
ncbi:DASS family sodium-coupled anion symporter [Helicobacter sp. MIT 14-3879]|uniref:SLC13 family permease n=1 Tax=Helicobacter sp. MIT 14-3879 TaxID=2040649 RepID=UPI000E1E5A32|nr:DASS family sodium-coupled anion symporter [Helicobacter sp. MIT 14-3879]RDU64674.1 Anion transporter [Helicobacter sp. MIT 14-3879]